MLSTREGDRRHRKGSRSQWSPEWKKTGCRLVPDRKVQDPIRVNVASDFNLRQATWRWSDPIKMDLPKRLVVLRHRTLSFEDLDENTRLVVSVRRERRLSLLRGTSGVVFDELRRCITSIDKGVTSNNSRFCTCDDPSPMRMAACTAAVTRRRVSRRCTLAPNHWSRMR